MARRRGGSRPVVAPWSQRKMAALLVGAALTAAVLVLGLVLAVLGAVRSPRPSAEAARAARGAVAASSRAALIAPGPGAAADPRAVLAAKAMPSVPESAAHPAAVSTADPGPPIVLPVATRIGPARVPTGFPHTPAGAMGQLVAVDQTALQSGSLAGARAVIAAWAVPGGPTPASWSAVRALAELLDAAGLSGGGSPQLALVAAALMGQIKGSVGEDFVVPCVDFEIDVTLQQTSRGAAADCQRMVWQDNRWMVGPGPEPALAPSVWPDTDTAISVGYRDLRHG